MPRTKSTVQGISALLSLSVASVLFAAAPRGVPVVPRHDHPAPVIVPVNAGHDLVGPLKGDVTVYPSRVDPIRIVIKGDAARGLYRKLKENDFPVQASTFVEQPRYYRVANDQFACFRIEPADGSKMFTFECHIFASKNDLSLRAPQSPSTNGDYYNSVGVGNWSTKSIETEDLDDVLLQN